MNPFLSTSKRSTGEEGQYSTDELRLANRNSGLLLELLDSDITPIGAHYLLNHFDVPLLDPSAHQLRFKGAFKNPHTIGMQEIQSLPSKTMPVTLECAGNGRSGVSPRSQSMPWMYEAVGTSEWTGTPLLPLIEKAEPTADVIELAFIGADRGFDNGIDHHFGRSLTLQQINELDVLLAYGMNGQPLLPQHGSPLRIIVPGWYGMASVKWLSSISALTTAFDGHQQIGTYHLKQSESDSGVPIQDMRVKSLIKPPGVPDWSSRKRCVSAGSVVLSGRAWSGNGRQIVRVEVGIEDSWYEAELSPPIGQYGWSTWTYSWDAQPGEHSICCRATDNEDNQQPLDAPWDIAGFANNAVHRVDVFVPNN